MGGRVGVHFRCDLELGFQGPSTGRCIVPFPCCFCWESEHLYPVMGVFTGLPFIATCFSGYASALVSLGDYCGIAVEGPLSLPSITELWEP